MLKKKRPKATTERKSTVRLPAKLYNEILAESEITLSSINEVIRRRLMITYGMMPDPRGKK